VSGFGDPLGYLERLGYGSELGVVPFRILGKRCFLVTDPDCVEQVVHTPMPPLSRGPTLGLKRWFGPSVFIAAGAAHDRERAFWQTLVQESVPESFAEAAVASARRAAARFDENPVVDVMREMTRLRREIDWYALTGGDLERDAPELAELLDVGFAAQTALITPLGTAYWHGPLPASRRLRAARQAVDGRIDSLVAATRAGDGDGDGSVIAEAVRVRKRLDILRTADDLRGFVKTFLVANQFDTVLAWTWYLIARNPEAEAGLHDELDREVPDRDPDAGDVARLRYTSAVVKECMRLLPPAWVLTRGVAEELSIGGRAVPPGSLVVLSQWVTHRDPRIWIGPTSFRPERWLDGEVARVPRFAYFPLSGGLYGCVGTNVVGTIAPLVVATIARRWRLRQPRDELLKPRPRFLLDPPSFTLTAERRSMQAQSGGRAG
jgi:cytochrome P450